MQIMHSKKAKKNRAVKSDDSSAPEIRRTSDRPNTINGRQSPPSLYKHLQKHYSIQFNDRPTSSDLFCDVDRRLMMPKSTSLSAVAVAGPSATSSKSAKSDDNGLADDDADDIDDDDLELEIHSFDTFYQQPSHLFMLNDHGSVNRNRSQSAARDHVIPSSLPDLSPYVPDLCIAAIGGSAPVMKCCICTQYRSAFFCDYCVRNGDFTSSRPNEVIKERFAEKKLRFFELKRRVDLINEKLEQKLKDRIEANRLRHELQVRQANVQQLTEAAEEIRKKFKALSREARDLQKQVPLARSKNKTLAKKLQIVTSQVESRKTVLNERKRQIAQINSNVEQCARQRIGQLSECIFPITVATPDDQLDSDHFNSCETSPLLTFSGESANESSCERDDNYFKREPKLKEERLSIVQSWLPVHGDYSAYLVCAIQQRDLVPSSSLLADHSLRNATQRISSALAFSTQFLSVIGFYLDCKFPRKLHFHEFDTKHDSNGRNVFLDEQQLAHKVAKLNANLFYFCIQQGVDLKLLKPCQTLRNLQLLTDFKFSKRLGNVYPIRLSSAATQLAENELGSDLTLITDEDQFDLSARTRGDDGNDDELNELDWESVPEMPYASEALSYSNTASVTTNIISSVVSMWRAATRK